MKKEYRIKKYSEIDAIFKVKKAKGNQCFVIYQDQEITNLDHFRFAISIGKKFGHAVNRNLIKRQIRAIVQEVKDSISPNKKFLIVIKPCANKLSFEEIKKQIIDLLKKSNLMENKNA